MAQIKTRSTSPGLEYYSTGKKIKKDKEEEESEAWTHRIRDWIRIQLKLLERRSKIWELQVKD